MSLLMLGGAVVGGLATAYGKQQENKQAARRLRLQKEYLAQREKLLAKQRQVAVKRLAGEMETQGMQATEASRGTATSAFLSESEAEAAAGVSGTIAGTAQFNIGDLGAENRRTILNIDRANEIGMSNLQLAGEEQKIGFDANQAALNMEKNELELMQDELDYASSPLSWGLSLASGALSGFQMGTEFQRMSDVLGPYIGGQNSVPTAQSAPVSSGGGSGTIMSAYSPGSAYAPRTTTPRFTLSNPLAALLPRKQPFSMLSGVQ